MAVVALLSGLCISWVLMPSGLTRPILVGGVPSELMPKTCGLVLYFVCSRSLLVSLV